MSATKFRQSDVTRALKGAMAAGLQVRGYTVDKDGKIVVHIGRAGDPTEAPDPAAEWDDLK